MYPFNDIDCFWTSMVLAREALPPPHKESPQSSAVPTSKRSPPAHSKHWLND
ncbi:hypothetical protein GCM10010985_38040 [Caballeronia grimmiae]|uniref:Uncharacterized protein n=1 Tax=Caballeronia grimmiae TaxID=1071679 RepID=A0ABQ1RTB4_9BURK|nr:hypothetical protein GCM10010985_38040 [Caballeronia grimmiae]